MRYGGWIVLALAGVLVVVGLLMQSSASVAGASAFHQRQMRWVPIAIGVAFALWFLPYEWLLRRAYLLYGVACLGLVAVLVVGSEINGSRRWLMIGGFSLQPSEPMKLCFILAMARLLRFRRDWSRPKALLAPALLLSVPTILVYGEPDLGTSLLFIPTALVMLFVAGARTQHMLFILLGGLLVGVAFFSLALQPYQKERVLSTIFRDRMTPIERRREGYQLEQSLRAVANGGLTGRGFKQGEQNRLNRLPHRHNDFVFAVVAEEFGFIGSVGLLLGLAGLLLAIFSVGHRTRDPGGRLVAAGVGVTLGVQVLLHVAVNVGLAPTTGMTLPFVSYGGTALLSAVSMVAVVASIKRKPRIVLDGDSLREQSARLS